MKTILVVEDDRVYARVVANWLVKNGLEARYVLSVASAKEFIAGTEVGLVLSDYRLQDGNGVELLEWMKANGYRMPFLIMTGYGDIPGAVEAVKIRSYGLSAQTRADGEGIDNYRRTATGTGETGEQTGLLPAYQPAGCEIAGTNPTGGSGRYADCADTWRIGYGKVKCGPAYTRTE